MMKLLVRDEVFPLPRFLSIIMAASVLVVLLSGCDSGELQGSEQHSEFNNGLVEASVQDVLEKELEAFEQTRSILNDAIERYNDYFVFDLAEEEFGFSLKLLQERIGDINKEMMDFYESHTPSEDITGEYFLIISLLMDTRIIVTELFDGSFIEDNVLPHDQLLLHFMKKVEEIETNLETISDIINYEE